MKKLGGWWRLWIVAAVLWGIVAGFGLVGQLTGQLSPSVFEGRYLNEFEMKLLSETTQALVISEDEAQDMGYQTSEGPVANLPKFPVLPPDHPLTELASYYQLPSGQRVFLKTKTTRAQRDSIQQDFTRVQHMLMWEQRRNVMLGYLLFWSIPCLSILALAQAGRWVAMGFKRANTP